jgi:hypothetical protein
MMKNAAAAALLLLLLLLKAEWVLENVFLFSSSFFLF